MVRATLRSWARVIDLPCPGCIQLSVGLEIQPTVADMAFPGRAVKDPSQDLPFPFSQTSRGHLGLLSAVEEKVFSVAVPYLFRPEKVEEAAG